MIKFFRKIRYDLMQTNQTGKPAFAAGRYLKYAISEIVLVVIGILIALSLNNWSENKKALAKNEMQLKALQIEFESNLSQLNQVLSYDNLVLNNTKKLLQIDPENSSEIPNDSMRHMLQNSSYRWTFNPVNGALRSAISSGEIHLIKSDSLVDLLFAWQDFVADAREDEERTVAAIVASIPVIGKYVRTVEYKSVFSPKLGESKFKSDFKGLLRDPLFEDFLGERFISMEGALIELNNVKKKNTLILELINKMLD